MTKNIKVRGWFLDKTQAVASRYNRYIDVFNRDENGAIPDDAVLVRGEVLGETEKAVKMDLETGGVVGSCMGWECWIPKSVILEEVGA